MESGIPLRRKIDGDIARAKGAVLSGNDAQKKMRIKNAAFRISGKKLLYLKQALELVSPN